MMGQPRSLTEAVRIMGNLSIPFSEREGARNFIEEFLVKPARCYAVDTEGAAAFRVGLLDIDARALNQALDTTMDSSLRKNVSCMVDAVVGDGPEIYRDDMEDPPTKFREKSYKAGGEALTIVPSRVRSLVSYIRKIGDPSVEGDAFLGSLTDDTSLFIVKARKDGKPITHEAVIGFYVANPMRNIVPNFAYVYGLAYCSPPKIDGKEIITWCSSQSTVGTYLVMENISGARSLEVTIHDVPVGEVRKIYLQIFSALSVAYELHGYTHYDLHAQNVLVKELSTEVAIPIYVAVKQLRGYVITKYVPVIIDYGYSRAKIGPFALGVLGLETFGVTHKDPFPMYDIYLLICHSAQGLYSSGKDNTPVYKFLTTLYNRFGERSTLSEKVKARLERGVYYTVDEKYRKIPTSSYISWMLQQGPTLQKVVPSGTPNIMTRSFDDTGTFMRYFSGKPIPTSGQYFQMLTSARKLGSTSVIKDLKSRYDTWNIYVREAAALRPHVAYINNNRDFRVDRVEATDIETMEKFMYQLKVLLKFKESLMTLMDWIDRQHKILGDALAAQGDQVGGPQSEKYAHGISMLAKQASNLRSYGKMYENNVSIAKDNYKAIGKAKATYYHVLPSILAL